MTTAAVLDLGVERFILESDDQTVNHYPIHEAMNFSLRSGNRRYRLVTLNELRDRSTNCRFCDLISRSVEAGDQDNNIPSGTGDAACFVSWEIDGRDSDGGVVGSRKTRRMRLIWEDENLKKV